MNSESHYLRPMAIKRVPAMRMRDIAGVTIFEAW